MPQFYNDDQPIPSTSRASKLPFISLVARIATFASLIVTIVILKTNDVTLDNGFKLTYSSYFLSYEYMFYISIIGLVYSIFQIPFGVYYLRARKRLIESYILLQVDFCGDKILAFLLATAVGAAFGATRDLKKYTPDRQSKINDFFDMAYISAVFLLIGCLSSIISSILASFCLAKSE